MACNYYDRDFKDINDDFKLLQRYINFDFVYIHRKRRQDISYFRLFMSVKLHAFQWHLNVLLRTERGIYYNLNNIV